MRIVLRQGIRRHDRRPLDAEAVARALRAAARTRAKPWLVGFGPTPAEPDVVVEDERTLTVHWAGSANALALRLAAAPLALVLRGRNGTGPYRPRLRAAELRLSQFRSAARGAPYLRQISVRAPQNREDELRAFELERLDASWRGAALYGQPRRPVQELTWPERVPVALALGARAQAYAAALAGALDRRRLARVGIAPGESVAGLPEPRLRGTAVPTQRLVLLVDADNQFELALGAALEARFDERSWPVTVTRASGAAHRRALSAGRWDLRIVQAPPALPGAQAAAASLLIALGDAGGATTVIAGRAADAERAMRSANAIVLGTRSAKLHTVASLHGPRFDALGRLRFERLFVRPENDAERE